MEIKIVLVDDHQVVRQGIRRLLDAEPDMKVVAEASDGFEAIQAVNDTKPDVVVLDIQMPGLNGLDVARRLLRDKQHPRVVFLSMYADEIYLREAMRLGAYSYVPKDAGISELITAIRFAARGQHYLSPPLSDLAIDALVGTKEQSAAGSKDELTMREREVLQLTAEGYNRTQIADRLNISPRTVDTHRTNLMRKLKLSNQQEAVQYARRLGILPHTGTNT